MQPQGYQDFERNLSKAVEEALKEHEASLRTNLEEVIGMSMEQHIKDHHNFHRLRQDLTQFKRAFLAGVGVALMSGTMGFMWSIIKGTYFPGEGE